LPDYGDSAIEDHPKAMAAARKALELDPNLSEPHAILGGQMMAQDWDFAGGIAEFKKAVELDPNNAETRRIYADNISLIGGMDQEAIAEVNRAHQLDPKSRLIKSEVGQVYITARQFDEAIAVLKKLANENPTYADAHLWLAIAYWGKKSYPEVIKEWKVSAQLSHDRNSSEFASSLAQGYRSAGWKGALTKGIEVMTVQRKGHPESAYGDTYFIAHMYADLGDKDRAFQWLNTALQEHDEYLMGFAD
jgi:tetratricopeptide (TPR) repeat protein